MKSSAAIPLVVAGYLYLNLFLLPGAPILLNGDQVFFWMDGQRILAGELPYRDFFQFTAPGTDLFYWATFKIFGTRIWVLNGVVLVLGVVLSCIGFSVAARIMDRKQAVLATFLFATLIYSKVLSATHHWFSVLAIMIAIGVLLPGLSAARLAVAGALLGIASFFTQTHGFVSLVGISLFLRKSTDPNQSWHRFWKNERLLLIGFAVTFLSLNAYFWPRLEWSNSSTTRASTYYEQRYPGQKQHCSECRITGYRISHFCRWCMTTSSILPSTRWFPRHTSSYTGE